MKTKINLNLFSNPKDSREACQRPFQCDGKLMATDGKIVIRLFDEPIPEGTPEGGPWIKHLKIEQRAGTGIPLPKWGKCQDCDGTGSAVCPSCGNDGVCRDCHGTGLESSPHLNIEVGNARISLWYAVRLATLPNVILFPEGQHEMVRFTFDGGEGAVMPVALVSK